MPRKAIEAYMHTETVFYSDEGVEVARIVNDDSQWWDTETVDAISEEELAEELGS